MQKNSDRVGLLRSRTEDEDIVSDQDEVVAMANVKSQVRTWIGYWHTEYV